MKTTKELYEIDPTDLKLLTYHEALYLKLEAGKKREIKLAKELQEAYDSKAGYEAVSRINADLKGLKKALKHTQFLVDEICK